MGRRPARLPALLAVALGAALALPTALLPVAPAQALSLIPGEQVRVDGGLLRGRVLLDHREFLGVPFAASTAGANRFRPPQPATAWAGERDATAHGNACPQNWPLDPQGEDCLNLDVYTPPAGGTNLPVIVWFHGGGYTRGSNRAYDPTPLVTRGKVIVVEVNYRLGPLGFLTLPDVPGNAGLLDQQAGLRWVQRNAAAFGGDPANVTIMGQSAGGNSVCLQLTSPGAAGLFAKAISMTGICSGTTGVKSPAEMNSTSAGFATQVGCPDAATRLACLRALPSAALVDPDDSSGSATLDLKWTPVVDPTVVPRSLDAAWRAGAQQRVPLLAGTSHDEGRFFVALTHAQTLRHVTAAEYEAAVRHDFGTDAAAVLARYPLTGPGALSPDVALSDVITDGRLVCPTVRHVAAVAADQPVYQYEFDDPDPPLGFVDPWMPMLNYHSGELFYLFGTVQSVPLVLNLSQRRLSAQVIDAWAAFARTGSPGTVGGVTWPRASGASSTPVLTLSSRGNTVRTDLAAQHSCGLWAGLPG